tara:strand:+ start:712 stop:822 length:111 start_codon:yes stop_codon:yes gene_type:complete
MFDWFAPTANWEAIAFAAAWFIVSIVVCFLVDYFAE